MLFPDRVEDVDKLVRIRGLRMDDSEEPWDRISSDWAAQLTAVVAVSDAVNKAAAWAWLVLRVHHDRFGTAADLGAAQHAAALVDGSHGVRFGNAQARAFRPEPAPVVEGDDGVVQRGKFDAVAARGALVSLCLLKTIFTNEQCGTFSVELHTAEHSTTSCHTSREM